MKTTFLKLIDFEKVDTLLEGFNKSTGFVTAILDLEGNVLSKSGWRQLCTGFHRVHPETAKKCAISDTVLANKMAEGQKYHFYQCLNGLVDVAVPIVVKGEHIANLFSGQFFFEEPDKDFFRQQGAKYGFNPEEYQQALRNVPVVSREKVTVAIDFLLNMTQMISEMTYQKLELMELNEMIRKSEERFRSIFENNLATMLLIEPSTHRIVDANHAAEQFYGWSRAQLIQMTVGQINTLPADELQKVMEIAASQKRIYFKFKHRRADGSVRDVEIYSSKVEIDGKYYLHSIIHDITEQVEAENKILKSEQILRLFVEHSPASIAMFDNNMRYLVVSHRFLIDYYLGNQELTGRSHYEVFPEISERWKEIHRRCLAGETIRENRDAFQRADGSTDWIRWEIRPWYETDNQIGGIILFSEVITQQVESELELAESETYNRMLFEQSAIGLALTTFEGKLVDINTTFSNIIGRTIEETKALTYWDITPEKYKKNEKEQLKVLAQVGRYGPYEKEYIHKDGHLVPVRLQGLVIERNNEKFIWSSIEDISNRKEAEMRIIESEKRYRYLFENNPLPMWIFDLQTLKFLEVNEAAVLHYGYSAQEFLSMTIKDIRLPEDILDLEKDLAELQHTNQWSGLGRHVKKNGNLIFVEIISHQIEYEGRAVRLVLSNDVTEKIIAEQKLHETNEYLENLFNYANAPIIVWDNSYRITRFNRAFEKLSGYAATEVLGREIDVLFPKAKIQTSLQMIEKTTSGERWESIEIEIQRKDQTVRTVLWNSANILDSKENQIIATIAQGQDITERKQAAEELERFFKLVPALVCIASMDGYFKKINDVWEKTLGFTKAELLAEPFENFIHPDDIESTRQEVARQVSGIITINFTNRYRTKTGDYKRLEWHATPSIDGTILYAAALDITERKLAEKALTESEEKYRSIFENSSVAILLTTPEGQILSANDFACQLFGRTEKEICEFGRNSLVDRSDNRLRKLLEEREATGHARGELTFLKKDGTPFECEISSVLFTDAEGNKRTSMVIRDLTEQKLAEQEILKLNQSLENKVALRTQQLTNAMKELETFTYSVSHDLKAPLRGIDGYSKLLSDLYAKELNDEAQYFITVIRNSTMQMNQLIEDLLQYSRLERSQLRSELVNIRQIVDSILKINQDDLLVQNFRIENDVPDISVFADSGGIQIALRNLIGNAIKFTRSADKPAIRVSMNETPGSWVIEVSDNGVGFDMKYQHRIFEIFQRLHRAEDYPGTGIGLAMVSKAMQRMNGRVWANSEPGKGATFYLELRKPN